MRAIFTLVIISVLCACTSNLTNQALQLKPITAANRDGCEFVKNFSTSSAGNGMMGNATAAMNTALNYAADAGANSYYVVSRSDTIFGSAVTIEAYKCNDSGKNVKANDNHNPLPEPSSRTTTERLRELDVMYRDGLINQTEFESKKKEILNSM